MRNPFLRHQIFVWIRFRRLMRQTFFYLDGQLLTQNSTTLNLDDELRSKSSILEALD